MSQDKKYREFWISEFVEYVTEDKPDFINPIHVIEIAALDELKAENERLVDDFNETWEHRDQLIRDAQKLTCQVVSLTAALRDMVRALEKCKHSDCIDPHIVFHCQCPKHKTLTKHADLIARLK